MNISKKLLLLPLMLLTSNAFAANPLRRAAMAVVVRATVLQIVVPRVCVAQATTSARSATLQHASSHCTSTECSDKKACDIAMNFQIYRILKLLSGENPQYAPVIMDSQLKHFAAPIITFLQEKRLPENFHLQANEPNPLILRALKGEELHIKQTIADLEKGLSVDLDALD